jgi:hypothetical protein
MAKQNLHIYFSDSISAVREPEKALARKACKYVKIISQNPQEYIKNIKTNLGLLMVDDIALPVTVNESEWSNAYTCSPFTHYISYAYDELPFIPNRLLRMLCWVFLAPLGPIFKFFKINKVVVVNNWLLSTCLYPKLTKVNVDDITKFLLKKYPQHVIQFRSLQYIQHSELLDILQDLGYLLVPSRQVYIWKPEYYSQSTKRQRKNFRQDKRMLHSDDISTELLDVCDADAVKLSQQLYTKLYIDKYSFCNPQLTEAFFRVVHQLNIIDIHLLEHKKSKQQAVIGLFRNEDTVTAPILGYNTDNRDARKMYRACSAFSYNVAQENDFVCHKSSGAPEFKRNRGCHSTIEYSAVYVKHLSWSRRVIWITLAGILNTFAVPIMKRYEL